MKPGNAHQLILIGAAVVLFLAGLGGCSGSPAVDAKKLPGTWRATQDGMSIIWTFSSNGHLRIQMEPERGWLKFIAELDVAGRWHLDGNQVMVEVTETPPGLALGGENWSGQTMTLRIVHLTESELKFADSDVLFRRSLVPPKP